uniref:WAT1-related protein n=1 Tax=Oryza punctata TaxID=4537 RepID=A0A0E0JFF2_ORYPU
MTEERPPVTSSIVAWTVKDAATGDELPRGTWTVGQPATTLWCPPPDTSQVSPDTSKYHMTRGGNHLISDRYHLIHHKYHMINDRNRLIPYRYHLIPCKYRLILIRVEVIRLRRLSGMAKMAGVGLCLGGVLVIALYSGPAISPLNHHRAFAGGPETSRSSGAATRTRTRWVKGTLLMLLSNVTWSLWIVMMSSLLKEYPCKLLATTLQSLLSAAQSLLLAAAVERDPAAWRLRLDAGLLAVAYSGIVVTGVSYYLQAWCIQKKGPVFLAMSSPLSFVFTIFSSSFFLGEVVHLGSVVGGVLMVAGLYSVLWGKSKEQDTLTLTAATATVTAAAVEQQETAAEPAPADSSNSDDSSDLQQGRLASADQQV